MIEIDVKKLREWAARCQGYYMMEISPDRIPALLDRLEAAEKDAERYRWLRADGCNSDEIYRRSCVYDGNTGNELDAIIDALVKRQGE